MFPSLLGGGRTPRSFCHSLPEAVESSLPVMWTSSQMCPGRGVAADPTLGGQICPPAPPLYRDNDGPRGCVAGPQRDTHGGGLPWWTPRCAEKWVLTAGHHLAGVAGSGSPGSSPRAFLDTQPHSLHSGSSADLRALRMQCLPLPKFFLQLSGGISGGDECDVAG